MQLKSFVFSPFSVNTYLVYDENKECVIIDAACYIKKEEEMLVNFIEENALKPVRLINTHCHLDHVFGNKFVSQKYGLLPEAHESETANNDFAAQAAENYGLTMAAPPKIAKLIDETQKLSFGESELEIRHAPGHTAGSLVFYNADANWVIAGDVLFKDSIGRTDLPGGNYDTLRKSVIEQLYSLPDQCRVFPGHGPATEIGYEKRNNPFITF